MGTLPNSEDPDEIQHNTEFHQGLIGLLRLKQADVPHGGLDISEDR